MISRSAKKIYMKNVLHLVMICEVFVKPGSADIGPIHVSKWKQFKYAESGPIA